jgi:hypothetical protein
MKYLKPIFLIAVTALSAAVQEEKAEPRICVSDSQSWEMAGGFGANNGTAGGAARIHRPPK